MAQLQRHDLFSSIAHRLHNNMARIITHQYFCIVQLAVISAYMNRPAGYGRIKLRPSDRPLSLGPCSISSSLEAAPYTGMK